MESALIFAIGIIVAFAVLGFVSSFIIKSHQGRMKRARTWDDLMAGENRATPMPQGAEPDKG